MSVKIKKPSTTSQPSSDFCCAKARGFAARGIRLFYFFKRAFRESGEESEGSEERLKISSLLLDKP